LPDPLLTRMRERALAAPAAAEGVNNGPQPRAERTRRQARPPTAR
jgi:hypothetical protein